jgi:hypothetical protein
MTSPARDIGTSRRHVRGAGRGGKGARHRLVRTGAGAVRPARQLVGEVHLVETVDGRGSTRRRSRASERSHRSCCRGHDARCRRPVARCRSPGRSSRTTRRRGRRLAKVEGGGPRSGPRGDPRRRAARSAVATPTSRPAGRPTAVLVLGDRGQGHRALRVRRGADRQAPVVARVTDARRAAGRRSERARRRPAWKRRRPRLARSASCACSSWPSSTTYLGNAYQSRAIGLERAVRARGRGSAVGGAGTTFVELLDCGDNRAHGAAAAACWARIAAWGDLGHRHLRRAVDRRPVVRRRRPLKASQQQDLSTLLLRFFIPR